MPSSHLILCRPLLLLPLMRPSIRVFSNESTLCTRWPKYWSFSFSIELTAKSLVSICHQVCSHIPGSPALAPSPLVTTALFFVSTCLFLFGLFIYFVFVWFVHLFCFCFMYSTYEWNHVVFIFVWLISLSIIPSRSICVPQVARFLLFFMAEKYSIMCVCVCVCVCVWHLLYPFIYWGALRLIPHLGYYK